MKQAFLATALVSAASLSQAAGFMLNSPDIQANGMIPPSFEYQGFGCAGDNTSPALKWRGAPKNTKAFAVTVYDPDAPSGSGWWHWMVINIPADVHELAANAGAVGDANVPQGARQIRSDFGTTGWGGMCPPQGDKPHHYTFTVYALKDKLDVPADATAALAGYMIHGNSLGKASFTARYGRPKAK